MIKTIIVDDDELCISVIEDMIDQLEEFSCVGTFQNALAAYTLKIPIAHIHGGETTEGAYDEAFRHSITKMSHIHFTSTNEYKNHQADQ